MEHRIAYSTATEIDLVEDYFSISVKKFNVKQTAIPIIPNLFDNIQCAGLNPLIVFKTPKTTRSACSWPFTLIPQKNIRHAATILENGTMYDILIVIIYVFLNKTLAIPYFFELAKISNVFFFFVDTLNVTFAALMTQNRLYYTRNYPPPQ